MTREEAARRLIELADEALKVAKELAQTDDVYVNLSEFGNSCAYVSVMDGYHPGRRSMYYLDCARYSFTDEITYRNYKEVEIVGKPL